MRWYEPTDRSDVETGSGPTRHDLVLAVIPSAFVVALLAAHLLSIPVRSAIGTAAFVGALAVLDALFLNPPRGPGSGRPTA